MVDVWVTAGNFDPRDIVNPIFAAFDDDVFPQTIHILTPSNTAASVDTVLPVLRTLAEGEGHEMDIVQHETDADSETFSTKVSSVFEEIDGASIALDITGRPSIYGSLLFQQAIADDIDADHVYHLDYLLPPATHDEDLYPLIPLTALSLTDIKADLTRGAEQ